jgi:DNA-binding CsgD family transcriptional regulator
MRAEKKWNEIVELLKLPENMNMSVRKLRKKFHVSDRALKVLLERAGLGRTSNACKGKIMREAFKSDPDAWQGKTLQELADFFKCNPATVRLACRECGILYKYGNGHHAETADFWNDVRDHPDWFEKLDLKAICLRYEVSVSTVRKAIEGGLKVQPTTHKYSQLRDEMRENPAKFDGMTPAAIAEKYGCSVGTAIKNGRFFGVKLHFERKKKVAPKSYKRKLLEGRKKEFVNLCKIMTLAELARHFNCVERTIRNYCDELGVKPIRKKLAPTPFVSEKEQEKREFFSELERDDEYFDVINRNRGMGISLTGDYWKRYREILAKKLRDGESNLYVPELKVNTKNKWRPHRNEVGYIF